MRCPRCFRRYPDDSRFCHFDGQRLLEFIDLDRLGSKPTERTGWVAAERYRVHGFIGRGSMAEVSRTRYERLVDGFRPGVRSSVPGVAAASRAVGRPADVLQLPDGSVLISDDVGHRLLRLSYRR